MGDYSQDAALFRAVFDSVADKYDLMNDLMSAGVHRLWKRYTLSQTGLRPGQAALDVAGEFVGPGRPLGVQRLVLLARGVGDLRLLDQSGLQQLRLEWGGLGHGSGSRGGAAGRHHTGRPPSPFRARAPARRCRS